MNILGISAYYHDSAACLVRDGEILAAAQEERFTRIKHDKEFPKNATAYCLREAGLTIHDVDYAAFYEKPFLKFERILETYISFSPQGIRTFCKVIPLWLKDKLWMKSVISQELGIDAQKILFAQHHQSHAASAFYPSPFERAAILTLDGVGEWDTVTWGTGAGNQMRLTHAIAFPHSLGLLYSAFTYYLGFKVNSGEYKVMGLAPYGEPRYADLIRRELIDIKEDGSFRLNLKYFNYCTGLTMTRKNFHRLFGGPPRQPESALEQRHMDLARSIQVVTEEVLLKMARHIHRETQEENLCLAGGVALNCTANGRLLREGPFKQIWIQPAAGDAGGALGAALLAWYEKSGQPRRVIPGKDTQKGSFLGPQYRREEIAHALKMEEAVYRELSPTDLARAVAKLLSDGNVIGWLSGRMEFGPRALGARSILGDPRNPEMQKKMNLKIKYRESFRPFAPTVLKERASDYFELTTESPYMLLVAPVRAERRKKLNPEEQRLQGFDKLKIPRSEIPAVTHVDYSARVQTLSREDHPAYYDLLKEFEKLTGCPVLINTSFNVRGEPIVCAPADAYRCFMSTQIDYLVVGNFLLSKKDQTTAVKFQERRKAFALD